MGPRQNRKRRSGLKVSVQLPARTALTYLQQLIEQVQLILAPGLRLIPHKLHQSCRQEKEHGELGQGLAWLTLSGASLSKCPCARQGSSVQLYQGGNGLREITWVTPTQHKLSTGPIHCLPAPNSKKPMTCG